MRLEERIKAFSQLGKQIKGLTPAELREIGGSAGRENPWFTQDNIKMALTGVSSFLTEPVLQQWTSSYFLEPRNPKTIGVAMAGNIPLAGFHDFLCVLISGHRLKAKLSSQDSVLLVYLMNRLIEWEPGFGTRIQFSDAVQGADAVIATGSNNTARYFEYYFRDIPYIIRKNRSSCSILTGEESPQELTDLGLDVFSYFGLGCRNISKLYLPEQYDSEKLFLSWRKYNSVLDHPKYANNYTYQKSILSVNNTPYLDNGFILMREDTSFVSPISILFYEFYSHPQELLNRIENHREKIQCMVSSRRWFNGSEEFGRAQFPRVFDYADHVDTLRFLEGLGG